MISDALFDAVEQMKIYLNDNVFKHAYSDPEINREILETMEKMDALRKKLDQPPI